MKKSTEYAVGESVLVGEITFTKSSEASGKGGEQANPETWNGSDGRDYEPTLPFQAGESEPAFNPLTLAQ